MQENGVGTVYSFGSALTKMLQHKKVAIVLTRIDNYAYYIYIFDLIEKLQKSGVIVSVVDVNCGSMITSNIIPTKMNKVRREKMKNRSEEYRKLFLNLILHKTNLEVLHINLEYLNYIKRMPGDSLHELLTIAGISQIAQKSIESICSTHITKTSDKKARLSRYQIGTITNLIALNQEICEKFLVLLKANSWDGVVILNGRVPDQSAVIEACQLRNTQWYSLEHGATVGEQYHIQDFQIQDNGRFQQFFWDNSKALEAPIKESFLNAANDWINTRIQIPPTFGSPIYSQGEDYFQNNTNRVAIFTSSLSEFDLYNPTPNGPDQILSICQVVETFLKRKNSDIVVRIHPNQINYAPRDLKRIVSSLSKYQIKIIFPWEADSSYEIASQADIRIFWDSTLGFETLVRFGSPVYILSSSFYDTLNGVRLLKMDESLELVRSEPLPQLDLDTAKIYLYFRYFGHGEKVEIHETILNLAENLEKIRDLHKISSKNRLLALLDYGISLLVQIFFRHASLLTYFEILSLLMGKKYARKFLTFLFLLGRR